MIENYPNGRRHHCESGTLVNMMEYYGYKISEPMAFGIGSGIYLMYFPLLRLKDSTLLVMRSRPSYIIRRFVKRMNVGYHEMTFGNDSIKAEKALDELVAKGIPVGVRANILGLKYLNDLGFDLDYNGHQMTVIGKEGTQYIVSDTETLLPDEYFKVDEAIIP
ncbi:MAG: BtrH N-terminal domain-containing protein [Bacteroidales bacterium]|nr:BtrH N-terminal domain-containing protein [Bacteroidales bacterium]